MSDSNFSFGVHGDVNIIELAESNPGWADMELPDDDLVIASAHVAPADDADAVSEDGKWTDMDIDELRRDVEGGLINAR